MVVNVAWLVQGVVKVTVHAVSRIDACVGKGPVSAWVSRWLPFSRDGASPLLLALPATELPLERIHLVRTLRTLVLPGHLATLSELAAGVATQLGSPLPIPIPTVVLRYCRNSKRIYLCCQSVRRHFFVTL